ncbi:MAG: polyvinylalcohol dehydrogenase [Planctomycetes bacterium]|nr:polyvinylalcohol dehydrogenase [Planctomycetota bacterium]
MLTGFRASLAGVVSTVVAVQAMAAEPFDWPQWQGPARNNVSVEKGLLKEWPAEGPKRVWTFSEAGAGYSGPSVAAGTLYLMGTRDSNEILIALDALTGSEKWVAELDTVFENGWGDGPRGTPTVDGDRVYAMSGTGTLVCAKTDSGDVVWRVTMKDLGGRRPNWGYCESVLIDGDWCLCTPGGAKGTIAALDKTTGKVIWQSGDFTDDAQYSSIVVAEIPGVKQYVQLTQSHVFGIMADGGALAWKADWPGRTAVIPTPIVHEDSVYVTSGYGAGCMRVRIGADQQVESVFTNKEMKNHHGGVVLVDGRLYGYSDGAGWICQSFETGQVIWSDKKTLGKGSLTCADGMLYCMSEDKGEVVLAEVSPESFRVRGRFVLSPQSENRAARGKIWTHPVVANGRLYIRDQEHLVCYDIKGTP